MIVRGRGRRRLLRPPRVTKFVVRNSKSLSITNLDQRRLPLMNSLGPRLIQCEPLPFVKPPRANVVSEYPQDPVHPPALPHPIFRPQIELFAVPLTPLSPPKLNPHHLL